MKAQGRHVLLEGWPWFGGGGYPISAYSEFMPAPRLGRTAYGSANAPLLRDDDLWGWPVTEYEKGLELSPGLAPMAQPLLERMVRLAVGRPAHGIPREDLADNPYWQVRDATPSDFHGEKRSNWTYASATDPDAHLFRKGKGKEAELCHIGHIMTENRHGLIIDARMTEANGTAECSTALDIGRRQGRRAQHARADKNDDTADFVAGCRARGCVPHVARTITNDARPSTRARRAIPATPSAWPSASASKSPSAG